MRRAAALGAVAAAMIVGGGGAGAAPPLFHGEQQAQQGAGDALWSAPAGAVAWYAAAGDGAGVRLVDGLLVGALRSAGEGRGDWAEGAARLLGLAAAFDGERRVALVGVAHEAGEGERLGVVLEVRGAAERVGALMGEVAGMAGAAAREVELPGGRRGMASGAWSWWSGEGRGLVGYGAGALDEWMREDGEGEAAEWVAHERAAGGPDGRLAAVFVDVNRLRRLLPESAGAGGLARVLEAWNVENARAIGVHVVGDEGGARVGVTWSARSRPPGTVGAGVAARVREGEGGVVLEAVSWPRVIDAMIRAKRATLGRWGRVEFDARVETWMRRHAAALGRTLAAVGDARVVAGGGAREGWPTIVLPLRDARGLGAVREEVRGMLADVRGVTEAEGVWRMPIAAAGGGVGLPEAVFVGFVEGEGAGVVVGWSAERAGEVVGEGERAK